MIGEQKNACLHDTGLGNWCVLCENVVGGSGPFIVRVGQIWRARGAPYGKIGIHAMDGHMVCWVQADGPHKMDEENFRDNFWFWGMPEKAELQQIFDASVGPLLEKVIQAETIIERFKANAEVESALQAFKKTYGVAPMIRILVTTKEPTVVVEWESESILKKVIKK